MIVLVSFVILSGLLLWAVIYGRGPWALKLALIVTIPFFGFVVRNAINAYAGFPLHYAPPRYAQVVGFVPDEPTWIYVWAIPPGSTQPRAYRIPYSRALHEQAQAIQGSRDQRPRGVKRMGPQGAFRFYRLPDSIPSKEG